MNATHLSDTHTKHESVKLNPCDILIHSGDFCGDAGRASMRSFLLWFEKQDAKHKILVAGNHDEALEKWPDLARAMIKEIAPSVTYLQDSGCEIKGVRFWGSPYQPEFCNWAFNLPRGPELKRHWDMIPSETDVLVTHGPAYGLRDVSGFDNKHCGCRDLYEALLRVEPQFHLYGHIHHSYGSVRLVSDQGRVTQCYNSSVCDEKYMPVNKPHEFEIPTSAQKV